MPQAAALADAIPDCHHGDAIGHHDRGVMRVQPVIERPPGQRRDRHTEPRRPSQLAGSVLVLLLKSTSANREEETMSSSDIASAPTAAAAYVIERRDGGIGGEDWSENFEGKEYGGAGISVILESTEKIGSGPRLHQHPYPETFIIRLGRALFTVGDRELIGSAGQILVVPANTPHKFSVLGPGRFESVNIHANDEFITEWLEPAK